MEKLTFPFIRKEGIYFVIGAKDEQDNQILLSNQELKILKKKLSVIDVDNFFWKNIL